MDSWRARQLVFLSSYSKSCPLQSITVNCIKRMQASEYFQDSEMVETLCSILGARLVGEEAQAGQQCRQKLVEYVKC